MEDKKKIETPISLSKARKIARKKEIAQMKRNRWLAKVITICVISAICIGLASLIGLSVYRNSFKVTPSDDYSAQLTDNGFIKDVTATSYVDLGDYKNIKVPASEIEFTDEELNAEITETLAGFATLNKETTAAIVNGDKVNIDYVGSIDGVEFEGGNTNGNGTDLEIGSGDYIDDFEDQLIGHKVGDKVTVNATFPEDYSNDTTKAGKEAVFEVVINGIYVAPELTDAFVKEKFSEYASTAAEYKAYIKKKNSDANLTEWLENYIASNTTVKSYPDAYIDYLKAIDKHFEMETFQYMNALYYQSMGYEPFSSFVSYLDTNKKMTEYEYDKSLIKTAQETAKVDLAYQAILESEGLTVTEEDYISYIESLGKTKEDYEKEVADYGKGYVLKNMVNIKAINQLKTYATVE